MADNNIIDITDAYEEIKNPSKNNSTNNLDRCIVRSVKDGVVICEGLASASYGEMVTINETDGMILNLEKDSVGIVIFGNDNTVKVGDGVIASGDLMSIKVSEGLLGRVVNALGIP